MAMEVNTEFYQLVNSMMASAVNGEAVDYDVNEFLDFGRKLSAMSTSDITNTFLTPLINKVKHFYDTYRTYSSKFDGDITTMNGYGILEVISHVLYKASEAVFPNLVDGNSYPFDKYYAPNINADYYTKEVAHDFEISIPAEEIQNAFSSPSAMANLINRILGDMENSMKIDDDEIIRNMIAGSILDLIDNGTTVVDYNGYGTRYKCLTIYNSYYDRSLTAEEAFTDADFINFMSSLIKAVQNRMTEPTDAFNTKEQVAFTPTGDTKAYIISELKDAIGRTVVNAFNPSGLNISGKAMNFWQTWEEPSKIFDENGSDTPPVLAYVYDVQHFVHQKEVKRTDSFFNPKGLFTTYFFHNQNRYCILPMTNNAVFTLD